MVKISNADLPELRDLLKSENYPETIFIHYFVDNYLNWLKKQPSTCVDFYSVDGKWRDGTFLGYLTVSIKMESGKQLRADGEGKILMLLPSTFKKKTHIEAFKTS